MNKMLIAAVLCAAACAGAPAARAATTAAPATLSNMTDVQLYCMWAPYATKCTTPAKPAMAKPMAKKVAMMKPAVAARPAVVGMKTMSCKPAAKAAGHLYDCVWTTH